MYVTERFDLQNKDEIFKIDPQFGYNGFGEYVYYKHYSRLMYDQSGKPYANEDWANTVIRNINGIFSIRKNHYVRNNIPWDETYWQSYALRMGVAQARMEWLPPGRGLWAMGSEYMYERGAMCLYNCAYTNIGDSWVEDLCWFMDCLMNGVGVGFGALGGMNDLIAPYDNHTYVIPDTREGWVEATRQVLMAFVEGSYPILDYSLIRPKGTPIRGFGGVASGPEPLMRMHNKMRELLLAYVHREEPYEDDVTGLNPYLLDHRPTATRLQNDLANMIGVCVVSGNVRRSAEISCGNIHDDPFWKLKDYDTYPYREGWGWMSNNSVKLVDRGDFENMDRIALANMQGHDVGYLNMRNFPHGRIGKFDPVKEDQAVGINPCGEIPLEHREVCNLAETLPTRCVDAESWLNACEYATFYTSTVTLLPTHSQSTNAIVNRNRRIGVSIIDFTGWKHQIGLASVTRHLREGYARVRQTNSRLAGEAGIPDSIRVTTVKPGGTVPKLPGRTSGAGHPTFHYTLRRVRVGNHEPIFQTLLSAGVPNEPEHYDPHNTTVFSFPIEQGPACPATEVSIWEQAMNIVLLQREWADNAVSNTLYFKPRWVTLSKHDSVSEAIAEMGPETVKQQVIYSSSLGCWLLQQFDPNHEEDQLESVLAAIAPHTKSISLLPHSGKGIFPQMPEEELSADEYNAMVQSMPSIDWSEYFGGDGVDEKFCTGEACQIQ